jgi:hypothetical protein
MDAQGFELSQLFSTLAPFSRARKIGLISCKSRGVIVGDSRVIDFDEKIDLTRGLEEALQATTAVSLSVEPANARTMPDQQGESVSLVRKVRKFDPTSLDPSVSPAIRIETGTEILATLPAVRSGEQMQSVEVKIPLLTQRLIINAGENYTTPLSELDLGEWEVLTPGWKFFADSNGKPIGVTRNIVVRQR